MWKTACTAPLLLWESLSLADSHELGRFTIFGLQSHSVCAMRAGMCEDHCKAVRARLSAWAVWHGIYDLWRDGSHSNDY